MKLQKYKLLYIAVVVILALLIASPVLQKVIGNSRTELFTEVWILDSTHKMDSYPFNLVSGMSSNVFIGLSNHLGKLSYYQIQVKLRDQYEPGPDSLNLTPSSQPALYNIYVFVADNETWELPLSFSLNFSVENETGSKAILESMKFNGDTVNLSNYQVLADANQHRLVNLYFEVWVFVESSDTFEYHERFVGLWLNLQSS